MNIQPLGKGIIVIPSDMMENKDGIELKMNCSFRIGEVVSVSSGVEEPIGIGDSVLYLDSRPLPNGQHIVQEKSVYAKIKKEE